MHDFEYVRVETETATLATFSKGSGRPLLLLHGYPQTHATWEKIAPILSEEFRCIVVDLPGYGLSQFSSAAACRKYSSKRAVAAILVKVMAELGYSEFDVLGHDRGARVAYRMALDHPNVVEKLGIIEIIPTSDMWASFDADMALKAYHWTFLAQPYPLPEDLITSAPIAYLESTLAAWTKSKSLAPFSPELWKAIGHSSVIQTASMRCAKIIVRVLGSTGNWTSEIAIRGERSHARCTLFGQAMDFLHEPEIRFHFGTHGPLL